MTAAPGYLNTAVQCLCPHAAGSHLVTDQQTRGACGGTVTGASGKRVRCPCTGLHPRRPRTPDVRRPDGSYTTTPLRECNGCGDDIGDATEREVVAGLLGQDLPDARQDCPACWAAANLPTPPRLTQRAAAGYHAKPPRTQARVGVRARG